MKPSRSTEKEWWESERDWQRMNRQTQRQWLREKLQLQYDIIAKTAEEMNVYEQESGVSYYDIPSVILSYWLHVGQARIIADLLHEPCRY